MGQSYSQLAWGKDLRITQFCTVFLYLTAIVTELLATPFRVTLSL